MIGRNEKFAAAVVEEMTWTRSELLAIREGRAPVASRRVEHEGSYSRYTHGCRCPRCREAARLHKRARAARSKAAA